MPTYSLLVKMTMTKIPPDDILEGLHKLGVRESETLKTVLELYDLEIHRKKIGPDMVKRSIEQDIRNKNFGACAEIMKETSWSRIQGQQRGPRILGDCRQWESNGQCSEGANCSLRHDINKRAKMTQPNSSPSSFMQQDETKSVENPKSQRKKSQW